MRNRRMIAAASFLLLILLPVQSRASKIRPTEDVAGTVTTTRYLFSSWTSSFLLAGAPGTPQAHVVTGGGSVKVNPFSPGVDQFFMTVTASVCCTVHAFVLGPWTGTWSMNGFNGDTLYGTATGGITAVCVSLDGFCDTPSIIGPSASFTLIITGGTGIYAGAYGAGTLSGAQTIEDAYDINPIPPAVFVGGLRLYIG
ncbi:MAG TPA: hypothetical protein VKV69_02860 [Actinomycetota bacterium]|nr:hypothetical protein [Actinomycetota bacterium]